MGSARPSLIASTPAMNVVLTAPSPTSNTPNLPLAGAICAPFFTGILRIYLRVTTTGLTRRTMIHETFGIRTSRDKFDQLTSTRRSQVARGSKKIDFRNLLLYLGRR